MTMNEPRFKIGEEVGVRGLRNKTLTIHSIKEEPKIGPFDSIVKYYMTNGDEYYEEILVKIKQKKGEKMFKKGDVVKYIGKSSKALKNGYYYLVRRYDETEVNEVKIHVDSLGSETNGFQARFFKKVETERHTKNQEIDGGKYMCVGDIHGKGQVFIYDKKTVELINEDFNNHYMMSSNQFAYIVEDKTDKKDEKKEDYGWGDYSSSQPESEEDGEDIPEFWGEPKAEGAPEKKVVTELFDVDIKTEMKAMFPSPILLEGPVGVGKSTLIMELAEELGLEYFASVLTDGTSKSEFTGYKNVVNGEYVSTEFRRCFEHGGLYNLEELNATTANLPIIFNTIENGYFVFADKKVEAHPDFRLVATMNTITNAKDFGGRRELDKSVKSRFHLIVMKNADDSRFEPYALEYAKAVNDMFEENGITDMVEPRDITRFQAMDKVKGISTEIAIRKCLVKNRLEVSDEKLRYIVLNGKEW